MYTMAWYDTSISQYTHTDPELKKEEEKGLEEEEELLFAYRV